MKLKMCTGLVLLVALYQNGLLSSLMVEHRVYLLNNLQDLGNLPSDVRVHGYQPAWNAILNNLPDEVYDHCQSSSKKRQR